MGKLDRLLEMVRLFRPLKAKVTCEDGSTTLLSGVDIISALHTSERPEVIAIDFISIPNGSGMLPDLIKGLVEYRSK